MLSSVEINTSFYRPHKPETYARWGDATPEGFRFALKAPRAITHDLRLADAFEPLERFLGESAALGDKRGPLLFQLPPSLPFEADVAVPFLKGLRRRYDGDAVLEPRHPSWFDAEPDALLASHRIARAAADPAKRPEGERPGGWRGLRYWRWHGSPKPYWSAYPQAALERLSAEVLNERAPCWVVFDNTASGAAAANALELKALIEGAPCEALAEPKD